MFKELHSKIQTENAFAMFFTDDFNCHSQLRCPDGDIPPESREIKERFSPLYLSEVIYKPKKNPLWIELLVNDQPDILIAAGTRASLDM